MDDIVVLSDVPGQNHSLKPFIQLDDSHFIKAIEFYLKFIRIYIDVQFFPKSEYLKKQGFLIEYKKGTIFSYQLKIDKDILDFSTCEHRIINMLNQGVPIDNLKLMFNKIYSLANYISELSNDQIIRKPNHKLILQFNHVNLEWGNFLEDSIDSDFHDYSNFDFVKYSTHIKTILEDRLGIQEFTNANENMNGHNYHNLHSEISTSETISYPIKTEAFIDFVRKIFELQLNPDIDYPLADSLGISEIRNTQFEYAFSRSHNFLDLVTFKQNISSLVKGSKSLKGPKALLRPLFETTIAINELFSKHIQYTTWDRTITLYIDYVKGSIIYFPGDSIYPEEFECLSSNDLAVRASNIHEFLKSVLFPEKIKKIKSSINAVPRDETKSNPSVLIKEVKPVVSNHPSDLSKDFLISEYINFIQDVEGYLKFAKTKLFEFPDPLDSQSRQDLELSADFKQEFYVKSSSPALVPSNFITKTREIKYRELLPKNELFPILENIYNKVNVILESCPSILSSYQFIIYFILPSTRNKVGVKFNPDDYNYNLDTYLSDIHLKGFCQEIAHFLKTEIFITLQPVLMDSIPIVGSDSGIPNILSPEIESERVTNEQFIFDTLDPLTIAKYPSGKHKKIVYCIDHSFRDYLKACFLALLNSSEIPGNTVMFQINLNEPFYDAILSIMEKFKFRTKLVIEIILVSQNLNCDNLKIGPPRNVRNQITCARNRSKKE